MGLSDYPIDVRFDYPPRSSRGWAALTIVLVKFLTLLPHVFVLFFLDIAQMVVAFVAQLAVAVTRRVPAGHVRLRGGRSALEHAGVGLRLVAHRPLSAVHPRPGGLPGRPRHRAARTEQPPLRAVHRPRRGRLRRRSHRALRALRQRRRQDRLGHAGRRTSGPGPIQPSLRVQSGYRVDRPAAPADRRPSASHCASDPGHRPAGHLVCGAVGDPVSERSTRGACSTSPPASCAGRRA